MATILPEIGPAPTGSLARAAIWVDERDYLSRSGGPHVSDQLSAGSSGWRSQAECIGTDPDLFFPLGASGAPLAQAEAAKRVCGECTVRIPCLQYALETNQTTGVWGGTDEDERRAIRRSWVRAGRPTTQLA